MTHRDRDKRYRSVSGLKHDLISIRALIQQGTPQDLERFELGRKDASSFFTLPQELIGRQTEVQLLSGAIRRAATRHQWAKQYSASMNEIDRASDDRESESSHRRTGTTSAESSRDSFGEDRAVTWTRNSRAFPVMAGEQSLVNLRKFREGNRQSRSYLVTVNGEAGSGKSSLVER